MLTPVIPALLAMLAVPLPAGTQLTYRGSLEPGRQEEALDASKTFDLTYLAAENGEAGSRLYWLIDERGQGGWPWPERFGLMSLDASGLAEGPAGPALLYDYGEGKSSVPLHPPLLAAPEPLAAGAAWMAEELKYEVVAEERFADRDAWRVNVADNFGSKRTLWIDKQSPLVVGLDERVIMDQGTEYRLRMVLAASEQLPPDQLAEAAADFAALVELRGKLKRPPQTEDESFSPDDRRLLAEGLPQIVKTAGDGPLARVLRAASRDLELQSGRADAVAELRERYIGQRVESFTAGRGRDTLTADDLAGKVTILHFWDYRHEPLEEPYGQVGYLEFLYSRYKEQGLEVYGIAVDGRLNDEATRGAAASGVRKLKAFMNLSYPIVLDGGGLLKKFGDPRLVGATLPLFVVVGRDGTILEYHVGDYEVDKQQGLAELDAVVAGAMEKGSGSRVRGSGRKE